VPVERCPGRMRRTTVARQATAGSSSPVRRRLMMRVIRRDITYRPRTHGESKVSGSWLGTVRAARDFWSVR
ncbi:hypothetical protein ACFROC_28655, partial [Nocardia tengchongensis]